MGIVGEGRRLRTPFATQDEFVANFHRHCGDATIFAPTEKKIAAGAECAFSIELADGEPMLRGLGVAIEALPTTDNRFGRAGVVIVPDRHGAGTNALLLSPPDVIEPSFGPGSFARHAARAHAAGTVVRVAEIRSLGLDVDTPDDLRVLRDALAARPDGAPRTRELLACLLSAAPAA